MENYGRRLLDIKRIYIISLCLEGHPESIKRFKSLEQKLLDSELSKYPIKIIGVNGSTIGNKYDHLLAGSFLYGHLKNMKGLKGASISHILCYLDILKDEIKGDVLILEDDSVINKDFLKLLPPFMPEDYHVFLPFVYSQKIYDSQNIYFYKNTKKVTKHQPYDAGALDIVTYFVNGNLIKDFTDKIIPIEESIPNILQDFSKNLNVYLMDPSLKLSGQKYESFRMRMDEEGRDYWMRFIYPEKEKEKIGSDYYIKVRMDPSMYHETDKTFEVYVSDQNNLKQKLNIKKFFTWEYPGTVCREFIEVAFQIPKENHLVNGQTYNLEFIYKNNFSEKILKSQLDIIYSLKQ